MLVIPFSFVGVLIALMIHGEPFSMLAGMGMVALMGVVVNDSLVYISFANKLRRDGLDKRAALIEAGKTRLRPIMLTTITTIVGLLPMSYNFGGGDKFLRPMGLSLIWGLFFATTVTLFILPCIYYFFDSGVKFLYKIFGLEYKLPGTLD